MTQVVVTFIGICTHVEAVPMTPPDDAADRPLPPRRYRRTVLVNARHGLRLHDEGIAPHEALLAIPKKHVPEPSPVKGCSCAERQKASGSGGLKGHGCTSLPERATYTPRNRSTRFRASPTVRGS